MDFISQLLDLPNRTIPLENVTDFRGELEILFRKELKHRRYSIFNKTTGEHTLSFTTKNY